MAIDRAADAAWNGDIRSGKGKLNCASGTLTDAPYSFATRFENASGTNPEELIAAAHAGCYSMAFSLILGNHGYEPRKIETHAVCSLEPKSGGGFAITRMRLQTSAEVPGVSESQLEDLAREAETACPVSNALRGGVSIELKATLLQPA